MTDSTRPCIMVDAGLSILLYLELPSKLGNTFSLASHCMQLLVCAKHTSISPLVVAAFILLHRVQEMRTHGSHSGGFTIASSCIEHSLFRWICDVVIIPLLSDPSLIC